jgi:hypothetical protein
MDGEAYSGANFSSEPWRRRDELRVAGRWERAVMSWGSLGARSSAGISGRSWLEEWRRDPHAPAAERMQLRAAAIGDAHA